MSFLKQLKNKDIYLYELSKLEEKYTDQDKLLFLRQNNVTLSNILYNKVDVSKKIAKSISMEEYHLSPAETFKITVSKKERELFRFKITDYLVHAAISNLLTQLIKDKMSEQLFSYRKAFSTWKALSKCSGYVRNYYKKNVYTPSKGLYVLCLDVASYTDSIFVGEGASIWTYLEELFEENNEKITPYVWNLIKNIIRIEVKNKGEHFTKYVGIATGSPISTFLFNFYLMDLDKKIEDYMNGFYARYADDIIYMNPDLSAVISAEDIILKKLSELRLSSKKEKTEHYFFNNAGKTSGSWDKERGISKVPYLGCQIDFKGTISLNHKKVKKFMSDLKNRIKNTLAELEDENIENKGQIICSMINHGLDPKSFLKLPYADYLRLIINDRGQLKNIDYSIALMIAEQISGIKTVKAFRKIPYKKIRDEWSLLSLVNCRNKKKESL
jgi:hypothetical protein